MLLEVGWSEVLPILVEVLKSLDKVDSSLRLLILDESDECVSFDAEGFSEDNDLVSCFTAPAPNKPELGLSTPDVEEGEGDEAELDGTDEGLVGAKDGTGVAAAAVAAALEYCCMSNTAASNNC